MAQLRIKLTLPYVFLALVIAFSATFLVTRLLDGLLRDRFQTALLDAGHQVTDTVVRVEREQLSTWRLIAYSEDFVDAVATGDGAGAALLVAPLVTNVELDVFQVLDSRGNPLAAMRHEIGGDAVDYDSTLTAAEYASWDVVDLVLRGEIDGQGDKHSDLEETDRGWVLYTAGPLYQDDEIAGILLVGTYVDELVRRLDAAALARVSIFAHAGAPVATTLNPERPEEAAMSQAEFESVLLNQEEEVPRRDMRVAGRGYSQILSVLEVRGGQDVGVISVALPLSFITDARAPTRQALLIFFSAAVALVLVVGGILASTVVRRVWELAYATQRVTQGDLSGSLDVRGFDEISDLGRDFNNMVRQLRDGKAYHDLLGMMASPEIADQMREVLEQGRLSSESKSMVATILFVDVRDYTRFAEGKDPAFILSYMNEYYGGLARALRAHRGVINKFVGDLAMAFFGVLPEPSPPAEGAHAALQAALQILDFVDEFNAAPSRRGQDPLRVGVGVHTGPVAAGVIGSDERLEYTLLGDTV
ncbi:MAG: HAMP domain-containing protein, partial [Anaerolineae bacterium]|nr:HAMP domain-containing protein [Anaerolineae bacterium]